MPLNHSFGVFPTSRLGLGAASSTGDLQKRMTELAWKTTSEDQHGIKKHSEADRNDNLWDVLEVAHKNTKLRRLPMREAPLMDRSSGCAHARDFCPKSMEDFEPNRTTAASMALTLRGKGTKPEPMPWPCETSSTYGKNFRGSLGEELRGAKLPSQGSKIGRPTNTLSATANSWVTVSHMENERQRPILAGKDGVPGRADIAWPVHRIKTYGRLGRAAAEDHFRSSFTTDFKTPRAEDEVVPKSISLPPHLVPIVDANVFETRRLPCMSIGA
jgi:hypothetical protein